MNEFTLDMALVFALIPVVQGVVEALKIAFLPSRAAPFVAILLGVGGVYLTGSFNENMGMMIITGAVVGLGAAGLYSFTKSNLERRFAAEVASESTGTPVVGSDVGGEQKVVVPTKDQEDAAAFIAKRDDVPVSYQEPEEEEK